MWTADYGVNNGIPPARPPAVPTGWATWAVWQYSSKGVGATYGAQSAQIDLNLGKEEFIHPGLTDAEKLSRLWEAHPELHA